MHTNTLTYAGYDEDNVRHLKVLIEHHQDENIAPGAAYYTETLQAPFSWKKEHFYLWVISRSHITTRSIKAPDNLHTSTCHMCGLCSRVTVLNCACTNVQKSLLGSECVP